MCQGTCTTPDIMNMKMLRALRSKPNSGPDAVSGMLQGSPKACSSHGLTLVSVRMALWIGELCST